MKIPYIAWVATLLFISLPAVQAATPEAGEYGHLILHDGAKTCTIDLATTTTVARPAMGKDVQGCHFGWVTGFSFESAKSAIIVQIRSFHVSGVQNPTNDCATNAVNGAFTYRFDLKTTKNSLSSEIFSYDQLFKVDIDADPVVVPGVRLLSSSRGTNPANKPLDQVFSCVNIRISD